METPREEPDRAQPAEPAASQESDQLPEEAPAEQVHNDDGHAASREEASENPGGRDDGEDSDPGEATGNPANAG